MDVRHSVFSMFTLSFVNVNVHVSVHEYKHIVHVYVDVHQYVDVYV